ncbi:ABC transporter substrate-binding protein [Pseudonocardia sp. TRM90224]|uniref:ABC transporter substrate-binding protein n=1 Tax=Pseudonocardia sp. TRM90224 TaxID=2812678 RepID=UPI001E3F67F4|nr:ABC transporter substrate-binding protein [Pseudonocardia sp. TRM90224]
MRFRTFRAAAVGIAVAALVLTACSGGPPRPAAPTGGGPLTIGMPNGPQTNNSNPFLTTSSARSLGYAYAIYEPLAQVNAVRPADKPTPWLASEWAWNPEYTSLSITARDGVTWSDGKPFTAEDIAYSFQIRKDNKALNADALPFGDIVTAGNKVTVTFSSGQFVNQNKVIDDFMVPKHIWSAFANPATELNQQPVGTGPYTLKSWTPQAVILTPRQGYWGGQPQVPELRYTSYNDNNALTNALVSGQAQWGWTFIADFERVYIAPDPANNHFVAPTGLSVDALFLNHEKAPFNNVAVRKALDMVINRQDVSTLATAGAFKPLTNVTGLPEPAGKDFIAAPFAGKGYNVDVEGAKKVLADAGYTLDGAVLKDPAGAPVEFTLVDPAGWSDYLTTLQLIADAVKPLGMNAKVETMTTEAWTNAVNQGNFQATLHWTNGGSTPWDMYSNMFDGAQYRAIGESATWNFGRFRDDESTKAFETYATSSDPAAREAALATLQKTFVEKVPAIAIIARPNAAEYSTKNYVGWPSDQDLYSSPQPTGIQASMILMKLRPAGS